MDDIRAHSYVMQILALEGYPANYIELFLKKKVAH